VIPVVPRHPAAGLVDTHCHPYLMEVEPASTFELARQAGVESFICVGIDPDSSLACLELARGHAGVVATAGLHPHEAASLDPRSRLRVEELLSDPLVVAVGEAGLDFFRMLSPVADQEAAFRWQLALARETHKPIVVHIRDAWERALEITAEEPEASVVLHCFSADALIARECAARGYFISFAGPITYPKNAHLREAAAAVPLDSVLTETDSPYLSPQAMRGRENSPANVVAVVEMIAEQRGEPFETVAEATRNNARRAFPGLR
jgi:TatD DNase family protein